jgi:pseudaminic acid cytidylyltransferase
MSLAVIPARGGSKRIPHKNIKSFFGRPIIAYAIEAARSCEMFDLVAVTTDDDEIAKISQEHGAHICITRPSELADDHTPTVPVIGSAIEHMRKLGRAFDSVCCIYPCNPFIEPSDIVSGYKLLIETEAPYCFPVARFPSPPQRALVLSSDGGLMPLEPQHELTRTQDLADTYYDAGQFYWGKSEAWESNTGIHTNGRALVIPSWRAIDIDTDEDWSRAELTYRALFERDGYG